LQAAVVEAGKLAVAVVLADIKQPQGFLLLEVRHIPLLLAVEEQRAFT
jgi:hypothetical protein